MDYYFKENGAIKGPVSRRSLISIIEYGTLGSSGEVRKCDEDWTTIGATEFTAFIPATPRKNKQQGKQMVGLGKGNNGFLAPLQDFFRRPSPYLRHRLALYFRSREYERWVKYYGDFDTEDYSARHVSGLRNETGYLLGEFVSWAKRYSPATESPLLLLAGESSQNAKEIAAILGFARCSSTGIIDCDYRWDFNEKRPEHLPGADVIISQSMLEHILSPYAHLFALSELLNPGGIIMLYTCMPGFDYHRYPHDTLRFHPDWFEAAADRLGLEVVKRRIAGFGIYYCLRRPVAPGL
jgi:hypothetical protein